MPIPDNYLEDHRQIVEDCDRMGREFVSTLKERTGNYDVKGIPEAIAAMFDQLTHGKIDLGSNMLPWAISRFMGMRMERYAPGIEALWNRLMKAGIDCCEKKVNNGGDNYVYATKASPFWRYVLICETQTRYFTVLLRYGSKAKFHPSELNDWNLEGDEPYQRIAAEYQRIVAKSYRPEIFIVQEKWSADKYQPQRMEDYSLLDADNLPSWQDDLSWDGYVAHLKDGLVDRGHLYYSKATYCLFSLASFIECVDESKNTKESQ